MRTLWGPQQVPAGNTLLAPTSWWEGARGGTGYSGSRRRTSCEDRTHPRAQTSGGHCSTLRARVHPTPTTSLGSLSGMCFPKYLFPAAFESRHISARTATCSHRFLNNYSQGPLQPFPSVCPLAVKSVIIMAFPLQLSQTFSHLNLTSTQ